MFDLEKKCEIPSWPEGSNVTSYCDRFLKGSSKNANIANPIELCLDNYVRYHVIQRIEIETLRAIPRTSGYQIFQAGVRSVCFH